VISQEQREKLAENQETEHLEDLIADTTKYGQYEGLYDETPEPGANGLYGLELNDGLTDLEMQFAERLAALARGVMVVHGNPGCGKGTFSAYIGWKIRRIFKGKRVLLDYMPKPLFDYSYDDNRYKFFNVDFMMDEVDRMADRAGKSIKRDADEELTGKEKEMARLMAQKWAYSKQAEVLMKDSVWELDELKRYLHNRHPNNRVGIQISNILTQWRHLRLLCLGMCPNINEIDWNGFLQYVTHEVRPEWCTRFKLHTTKCIIRRKSHVSNTGVVKFESKPYPLYVNGGRPRPEIGVQLLNPDISMGEPEKRVVSYIQAKGGMSNLNEISDNTGEEINECRLRLLKMHGVFPSPDKLLYNPESLIRCMTVFNLFNSLDYKNLNPARSKMEE
jgi:hypothetical protein